MFKHDLSSPGNHVQTSFISVEDINLQSSVQLFYNVHRTLYTVQCTV